MSFNSKPRRVPRREPTHSVTREQHDDKQFISSTALEQHNKQVDTEIRPYNCETCGKGFNWKCNLCRHKRIYRDERPYQYLERYNKEIYTEVRPYKCGTCGKGFKWTSSLCQHKKIHRGGKPYKCEFCEKAFTQTGQLKVHKEAMHINKNYKCIVKMCEKVFKTQQNMHYHIHTDHPHKRLFKCIQCPSTFTHYYNLNSHIHRVHIDKKHLCKICGKAFRTKQQKDRHSTVHSDKKPYVCVVCGKGYKRKVSLDVHIKRAKDHMDNIVEN